MVSKSKSKSFISNISLWDIVIALIIGLLICSFLSGSKLIEGVDGEDGEDDGDDEDGDGGEGSTPPKHVCSVGSGEPGITCPLDRTDNSTDNSTSICIGEHTYNDTTCAQACDENKDICRKIVKNDYKPTNKALRGEDHRVLRSIVNNLEESPENTALQTLMNSKSSVSKIPIILNNNDYDNNVDTISGDQTINILTHFYNDLKVKNPSKKTNKIFNSHIMKIIYAKKDECSKDFIEQSKQGDTEEDKLKLQEWAVLNNWGHIVGYNYKDGLYCLNPIEDIYIGPYCKKDTNGKKEPICNRKDVDIGARPSEAKERGEQWFDMWSASLNIQGKFKNPCIDNTDCKSNIFFNKIDEWPSSIYNKIFD